MEVEFSSFERSTGTEVSVLGIFAKGGSRPIRIYFVTKSHRRIGQRRSVPHSVRLTAESSWGLSDFRTDGAVLCGVGFGGFCGFFRGLGHSRLS